MNQTKMFAVCGVLGAAAGVASAQDVILQDGSAIATFSETTAGGYFQPAWEINGVNQLADQSFFVVTATCAVVMTQRRSARSADLRRRRRSPTRNGA